MDAASGAIMFQRGADDLIYPASMSKLMLLAVTFKALKAGQIKLDDEFFMSEYAWRRGGAPSGTSAMMVPVGKKAKLDELLKGIIVQSGNDAAISVAENIAGNESLFAKRMMEEARPIGLKKSTFKNATGLHDSIQLKKILNYEEGPTFPADYRPVNTRVLASPPSQFEQQIVVAAGSKQGIHRYDPVVTPGGLVGDVTKVFSNVARVTLLTDDQSAVGAMNLHGASGLVRHGASPEGTLILDQVTKDQVVYRGDRVLTQGSLAGGLPSIYPRGIPIGTVTHVGQSDVGLYKDIQVSPFVDFSSLESVIVLVPKVRSAQLP